MPTSTSGHQSSARSAQSLPKAHGGGDRTGGQQQAPGHQRPPAHRADGEHQAKDPDQEEANARGR